MEPKSIDAKPVEAAGDDSPGHEIRPGTVLGGRYRVLSLLGTGGMGVVYRVNQIFLDKELALKTIDKRHISDVTIRRFQQEARVVCAINHPNIISVHDFGLLDEETPFLVMEVVNGDTLNERLKKTGPMALEEAIPAFVQVCFGLAYAHEQGIVHRDMKPSNIMLLSGQASGNATVKILDFGIAKLSQHEGGEIQALTRTGEIFGSPLYMSPEQCAGQRVDHRSDIYSLGCVLFESLTGTPPFVGENALATMMQHTSSSPPTLKEASLGKEFPPELEKILASALAKSPQSRYQNLGLMAHDLGALRRGEPITGKPSASTAQTHAKTISLPNKTFYALLLGTALLSAAIAGISVDQLDRAHNVSAPPFETVTPPKQPAALRQNSRQTFKANDGTEYIVFRFAQDQDLGNFSTGVVKQAPGEITIKKSAFTTFRPSATFLQDPRNFALFQPNDLFSLNLRRSLPEERITQIMSQIGRLTGLVNLDLGSNNIEDAALETIGKLPNLRALNVQGTNITGSALSRLPTLLKLNSLNFAHCVGASDLLKVLKQSSQLTDLALDSDRLSAADFKTIGTIAGLRYLDVNATGMHNSDLLSLTALTKLEELQAKDCPLTGMAIPSLKLMVRNGLRRLSLSPSSFSPKDVDVIKKELLPNVYFKPEPQAGLLLKKELEERAARDFIGPDKRPW